jgi:SpoVK/Ycf46/Vps4 family AAA+-type ATPase
MFSWTWTSLTNLHRPVYSVEIQKPTPRAAIGLVVALVRCGRFVGRLAAQFNLSQREIEQITAAVPDEEEITGHSLEEHLWKACLTASRPKLERLAQRIDAKATWDDIVLAVEERALLRQIAAQVGSRSRVYDEWGFRQRMNRGLGISALFAGESGTGKTMAAEVIANELKLHLYRIDLSAVVNKYIGETEKNLRRVFDAAEDSGAILFFDEADALFGKRGQKGRSLRQHEINYLLQRMEAIGARRPRHQQKAPDPSPCADCVIEFPIPGAGRKLIWQRLPKADGMVSPMPVEGLN